MSINILINKEAVVHGILLSHKKEHIWLNSNEVDEPRVYYTEWSKSEKQMLYICIFAWKWKVKVKSLSRIRLLVTPWTTALQASLSFTISWSLFKFMFIEDMSQDKREKQLFLPKSPETKEIISSGVKNTVPISKNGHHLSLLEQGMWTKDVP